MTSRRERIVDGLAEEEESLPKSRGRTGIPTHRSHIFWSFRFTGFVLCAST